MCPLRRILPAVFLLLSAVGLTAASGCRFGAEGEGAKTPPLFVRNTVPRDSTEFTYPGDPIPFVIDFNRATTKSEVEVKLVPAPLSAGEWSSSPSGRTLTWFDLELEGDEAGYRALIDGPSMPWPVLVTFYPGLRPGVQGWIGGWIKTVHPSAGENAMVFALREGRPDPDRPHLEIFADRSLESVAPVVVTTSLENGRWVVGALEDTTIYRLVAILDTSGDGLYSLEDDWSGNSTARASADPFTMTTDLRIEILPPGVADFGDPQGVPEDR